MSKNNHVKQVIVIRNDLNMRKGKMIVQGAHASLKFLVEQISSCTSDKVSLSLSDEINEWIAGTFAKICLQIDSEQALDEIYAKAKEAGLTVHMVVDAGFTEFNGVPTKTCLAIGPHFSDKINPITSHLKLL